MRLSGLELGDLLSDEFLQRRQSGYDVGNLEEPILRASANSSIAECEQPFELLEEAYYARTVGLAVQGGRDTDCNSATAGSAFGAMHGTGSLPGSWVEALNDRVRSAVAGFDDSRISDLAERTLRLAGAYAKGSREPGT